MEFSIKEFIFDKKIISIFLLVAAFILAKVGFCLDGILFITLCYILILLSAIDYRYKAVPDYLLIIVLIISPFLADNLIEFFKNSAMFAGFFVILNIFVTYYIQNIKSYLTKDETLKEQVALGEGDIPIFAMIGGLLGVQMGFYAIMLGSMIALIHSIYNRLKYERETPFIPYLVMGFWILFLFGDYFSIEWLIK